MVYQDPMSSLNPVIPIGKQLMEVPIIHFGQSETEAHARALQMLREVNLPDPETMMTRYPHQLSGGQQQRVVIAMALMAEPSLLVMDEPTTGLDVTVEAAVLDLVRGCARSTIPSIIFISHNLGTVVRICDRIGVMYAGELVEEGPITEVFRNPRHPYTRGLLSCIPTLGADKNSRPLTAIPGQVPSILNRPKGCVFQPRCKFAQAGPLQPGSAADPRHERAAYRASACGRTSCRSMRSCRRASKRSRSARRRSTPKWCCRSRTCARPIINPPACSAAPATTCTRSTTSTSPPIAARPWRSSASPAAASPPSPRC